MENTISVEVRIRVTDMYRFFLYHAYCGYSGILGVIVSAGALVLLLLGLADSDFSRAMLILLALLFTVINPVQLYLKAARQVTMTPAFKKPLCYEFSKEGMTVRQDEEEITVRWEEFQKGVVRKKELFLYTSAVHASILPKECCGERWDELIRLVKNSMEGRLHGRMR